MYIHFSIVCPEHCYTMYWNRTKVCQWFHLISTWLYNRVHQRNELVITWFKDRGICFKNYSIAYPKPQNKKYCSQQLHGCKRASRFLCCTVLLYKVFGVQHQKWVELPWFAWSSKREVLGKLRVLNLKDPCLIEKRPYHRLFYAQKAHFHWWSRPSKPLTPLHNKINKQHNTVHARFHIINIVNLPLVLSVRFRPNMRYHTHTH